MSLPKKLAIFLPSLAIFIPAFIINITSDTALYNQNLNVVPQWQSANTISSEGFMVFMNLVSILFDPPVCAAYLAVLWLFSARRLEVMVFLLWFIFMSWLLSITKVAIHQPRPFWLPGSQMQMKSWTCYTEYGSPSGHSWFALVLLQYLVRFFARGYPKCNKFIILGYILIIVLQCLVMFSRVILGMHTFNQVLFGTTIGMFMIAFYYIFVERFMVKLALTFLGNEGGFQYFMSMDRDIRKRALVLICLWGFIATALVDFLLVFLPTYDNQGYWTVIQSIKGCESVKLVRSFQYRCLQDLAILQAAFGIAIGMIMMKNPGTLCRNLSYSRCSGKHRLRLLIMVLVAGIPVGLLVNPLWQKIPVDTVWLSTILWVTQSLGFFLGLFLLIYASPIFLFKANLDTYSQICYTYPQSQQNPKQIQLDNSNGSQP